MSKVQTRDVVVRTIRRYARVMVPCPSRPGKFTFFVVLVCAQCGIRFWFHESSCGNQWELRQARNHFGGGWPIFCETL